MNIIDLLNRMNLTRNGSEGRRAVVVGNVKFKGVQVSLDLQLDPRPGDVVEFGGGKHTVTEKDLS